jgi:hypothetical protein
MWVHCHSLHTHQKRAPDLIADGCEPPCGCWELNSGPLEEQSVLLTPEPSLQPTSLFFYRIPTCFASFPHAFLRAYLSYIFSTRVPKIDVCAWCGTGGARPDFILLKQDLIVKLWLIWNLLCTSGWPRTCRDPRAWAPCAGIKSVCQHTWRVTCFWCSAFDFGWLPAHGGVSSNSVRGTPLCGDLLRQPLWSKWPWGLVLWTPNFSDFTVLGGGLGIREQWDAMVLLESLRLGLSLLSVKAWLGLEDQCLRQWFSTCGLKPVGVEGPFPRGWLSDILHVRCLHYHP